MTKLGIPKRLILLSQMTLAETKSAVRIAKKVPKPFKKQKLSVWRNRQHLEHSYLRIVNAAELRGLKVNIGKTKYMQSSTNPTSNQSGSIKIGGFRFDFEAVQNFTYLGSSVNTTNDVTEENKRRIMLANRTLRSKVVRRNTKLKIYIEA